jgi:hypothetical protein
VNVYFKIAVAWAGLSDARLPSSCAFWQNCPGVNVNLEREELKWEGRAGNSLCLLQLPLLTNGNMNLAYFDFKPIHE